MNVEVLTLLRPNPFADVSGWELVISNSETIFVSGLFRGSLPDYRRLLLPLEKQDLPQKLCLFILPSLLQKQQRFGAIV